MNETKIKGNNTVIIENATMLFSQYGTQSVSMDEIAKNCGISKKTIYEFFDSKEMLINVIVKEILIKSAKDLNDVSADSFDVLSEMNSLLEKLKKIIAVLTPPFFRDVKKYYPSSYQTFVEFREKTILPFVNQNIKKGVSQNVYRIDTDCEIISILYCWQLQNVYESVYSPLTTDILLSQVNQLLFNGILTPSYMQLTPNKKIQANIL